MKITQQFSAVKEVAKSLRYGKPVVSDPAPGMLDDVSSKMKRLAPPFLAVDFPHVHMAQIPE
ncbi:MULTISPECIES: hypothetical protein [Streptomyces griseus group]|uniref:Uncharacterized protein n=1 Tax=Streptomyces microflavus TaxID=1919 RepID=A0A7H8MPM5_STRMI|nr:hypothetical protein [Streptomyces microflavus]QKW44459.1 hypothetical protein HUT09_19070 [Streptomyces microflavus]